MRSWAAGQENISRLAFTGAFYLQFERGAFRMGCQEYSWKVACLRKKHQRGQVTLSRTKGCARGCKGKCEQRNGHEQTPCVSAHSFSQMTKRSGAEIPRERVLCEAGTCRTMGLLRRETQSAFPRLLCSHTCQVRLASTARTWTRLGQSPNECAEGQKERELRE